MLKRFSIVLLTLILCWPALAIERRHGILVGVVIKVDSGAKTVVVKAADGTEHTLHFVKRTTVHGAQDTAAAAKDVFHGVKEGGEVAVPLIAAAATCHLAGCLVEIMQQLSTPIHHVIIAYCNSFCKHQMQIATMRPCAPQGT